MHTYDLYWSPEGRKIATVCAPDASKAIRKAPKPYRKYLGEIRAEQVTKETVFEIVVGNIGTVYAGNNFMQASCKFNAYVKLSNSNSGRASGEPVTLFHNGDIRREHVPMTKKQLESGAITTSELTRSVKERGV